ncbi:MAG: hypothetical protein K2M39_04280, partial [Muribaculaceae bacterium]|nr:hypothetical protein [Muribaculaceae bacterium]
MIQFLSRFGRNNPDTQGFFPSWLIRLSILTAIMLTYSTTNAATLLYSGSIPEDGSNVSSFDDITLLFDFSEVIEEHGEGEWGICVSSTYSANRPEKNKIAALYKGSVDDGELLGYIAETIKASGENFKPGNKLHLSFPDVQVETNQVYTLKLTYELYAGRAADGNSWTTDTKLSLFSEPLTLTFIGGSEVAHVLNMESSNLDTAQEYEFLPEMIIDFNYPISITQKAGVEIKEDGSVLATADNITVDPANEKAIKISFPETSLYKGHSYQIVVAPESVCINGEEDVTNKELNFTIKGASYRYFGVGRVRPSSGSESVMAEITVPFKFPEAVDKNYGFVNVDNGRKKWYIHLYEGAAAEGEELMQIEGEIGSDMKSLIFHPEYAFKPETEYTLVIPEGDVLAYEIGALRETFLKDYISERVELHYTTPSVASLPAWTPSPVNVKNNAEVSELKYFIIDCPAYEYNGTDYNTVSTKVSGNKGSLYLVTDEGDQQIKTFAITRKTLDSESEIGNGELNGRYFVGKVNENLYEGNEYKVVWAANSFIVDNSFIGQYVGNPEVTVTLKGTAPTVHDFGLTANVENRRHSHADLFSFVTGSEIKAGDEARMILKDGETSVAEAPVYVAHENTSYRAYADFGGKKLESGKTYDVVIPEGSIYSANGIESNPEIRSSITAASGAEYVSVALSIDEYASATYRMVMGEESVIALKAGEAWKLESLSLDGNDVTSEVSEAGLYTLPALSKDAKLDATYAYAGDVDYDFTTGIGSVSGCSYELRKDGSHLVISGLKEGDMITIYTAGGMKVADLPSVPSDMQEASIALQENQVYIILINGTS